MPADRPRYEPVARDAARRHGVPEELFVRQIAQESAFNPDAVSPAGAVGIAQIVPRFHPHVDARDPIASLDYAAEWMSRLHGQYGTWALALAAYNAGPSAVQQHGGVPPYPETRRYLDAILGPDWTEPAATAPVVRPYDPDFPLRLQRQDWACSIRALQMALNSVGRTPDIGWLQDTMVREGVVNSDVGLTRGDASLLVEFVRRQYPEVAPRRIHPATFDDALALAGRQPLLLGGHGWGGVGHWVAIRRAEGDRLILANPGGTGPRFGQQELTRSTWQTVAPGGWTLVTFDGVAAPPVPAPPTDRRDARIRELETILAEVCRGDVRRALEDLRDKTLDEVLREIGNITNRLETIADEAGLAAPG